MTWLKKLSSFALMLFAFCFLFSASLSSCGNKKTEKENTEHPAEEDTANSEHPEGEATGGEHPEGESEIPQK